MFLADGTEIPDEFVEALNELDKRWPGATLPQARGAIVSAVLSAYMTSAGQSEFEPMFMWRLLGPNEELKCEDSNKAEVLQFREPGDILQRLYTKTSDVWVWRTEE